MVATETAANSFKRYDENGYLIESTITYDTNSETYKYHFFAPTNEWYMSEIRDDHKREYTIDDNSVTLTEMTKLGDGKWYYRSVSTIYIDNEGNQIGELNKEYICNEGQENVVENAYGNRYFTRTENGKIVASNESFNQEMDKWVCHSMTVTSANYYDPYIYKPGEVRTEENYYDTNGDGVIGTDEISEKRVITWVKDRIMKKEYTDYSYNESEVSYLLADEDGKDYESIYYNTENGSYCVNIWNENDRSEYYTFYDSNHNELESFRSLNNDSDLDTWEMKKGNEWVKCTGTVTVWSGADDKYVITFDAQGRMTRYEEWEYDDLDEYSEYTYDATGWTRTDYSAYEVDGSDKLEYRKSMESGYHTLADGSVEDWYIDFYDGTTYGRKTIAYENGSRKNYEYRDGEWYFQEWSVNDKETELADGFIEVIIYEIDQEGNISNWKKEIRKDIYENEYNYSYYESYTWDAQTSAWVGETKNVRESNYPNARYEDYMWSTTDNNWILISKTIEQESKFPEIDYIAPVDPLVINDEYFFETEKYPDSSSLNYFALSYSWNEEKKELELTNAQGEEFTKISDTEVKITDYNNIWDGIVTGYFKVDDQRRVTEYKNTTWAYNDKNQVVEKVIGPERYNNSNTKYEYNYSDLKVWNGIDEIAGEDASVVATYNLAGVAVDTDKLAAGIYIQKLSNGTSRKIVVK